jgi:hypothetical protein
MFNQLLLKSFNVGDKIFHVLCDMQINTGNLKDLGNEIVKFANDLEEQAKQAEEKQEAEAPHEEEKPSV